MELDYSTLNTFYEIPNIKEALLNYANKKEIIEKLFDLDKAKFVEFFDVQYLFQNKLLYERVAMNLMDYSLVHKSYTKKDLELLILDMGLDIYSNNLLNKYTRDYLNGNIDLDMVKYIFNNLLNKSKKYDFNNVLRDFNDIKFLSKILDLYVNFGDFDIYINNVTDADKLQAIITYIKNTYPNLDLSKIYKKYDNLVQKITAAQLREQKFLIDQQINQLIKDNNIDEAIIIFNQYNGMFNLTQTAGNLELFYRLNPNLVIDMHIFRNFYYQQLKRRDIEKYQFDIIPPYSDDLIKYLITNFTIQGSDLPEYLLSEIIIIMFKFNILYEGKYQTEVANMISRNYEYIKNNATNILNNAINTYDYELIDFVLKLFIANTLIFNIKKNEISTNARKLFEEINQRFIDFNFETYGVKNLIELIDNYDALKSNSRISIITYTSMETEYVNVFKTSMGVKFSIDTMYRYYNVALHIKINKLLDEYQKLLEQYAKYDFLHKKWVLK